MSDVRLEIVAMRTRSPSHLGRINDSSVQQQQQHPAVRQRSAWSHSVRTQLAANRSRHGDAVHQTDNMASICIIVNGFVDNLLMPLPSTLSYRL